MKTFDVYAHHPYAGHRQERVAELRAEGQAERRVQLGNISLLTKLVSQYYGPKHLWITEYGYQTNPPDKTFGSRAKQAHYLKQSFAIARKNPRIDMMLWFLVRDEPAVGGWQSGLQTVTGKKKPAWSAFLACRAASPQSFRLLPRRVPREERPVQAVDVVDEPLDRVPLQHARPSLRAHLRAALGIACEVGEVVGDRVRVAEIDEESVDFVADDVRHAADPRRDGGPAGRERLDHADRRPSFAEGSMRRRSLRRSGATSSW